MLDIKKLIINFFIQILLHIMQPVVHIIEIVGKLEIAIGKELIDAIHAIMEFYPQFIILDLQKVDFADSGGLGSVIRAFKISQELGTRFAICTEQSQVLSIFQLTSINQIIEVYKNKEEFYEKLKTEIPEYSYLSEIPEISVSLKLP